LYFASVITTLVEETNRYYKQYWDRLDNWRSPLVDVTETKMFLFLTTIAQTVYDTCVSLSRLLVDYWTVPYTFFHG
jgi:hypothetical protein